MLLLFACSGRYPGKQHSISSYVANVLQRVLCTKRNLSGGRKHAGDSLKRACRFQTASLCRRWFTGPTPEARHKRSPRNMCMSGSHYILLLRVCLRILCPYGGQIFFVNYSPHRAHRRLDLCARPNATRRRRNYAHAFNAFNLGRALS